MSSTTALTQRTKPSAISFIAIELIAGYKKFVSPLLHQVLGVKTACRFSPDCSVYAQESIRHYGFGRGILLSVRRLINCQPFFTL